MGRGGGKGVDRHREGGGREGVDKDKDKQAQTNTKEVKYLVFNAHSSVTVTPGLGA